jgi:hypothetical protein
LPQKEAAVSFSLIAVNYWAVLVSGVVYFLAGALWYGLLAEQWMKGVGKSREELTQRPIDYILSLIGEILLAFVLAISLNAFGTTGLGEAIFVAALLWFGFALLPEIVHYAYEEKTFALLAINKGYDLLGMILAAIILSLWR